MSRFINLEFDPAQKDGAAPVAIKGEAHYLESAAKAFAQADFDQALRLASKVLEFNPRNAAAWTWQVRALIELKEYGEAKRWADQALERFPDGIELLAAQGVILARTGDLQGAISFSDSALEMLAATPYLWLARGDVMLARREKRADYCFEKAQALAPNDWTIPWLASRIRHFYEQYALALRLVQPAVERHPEQGVLWWQLGLCQKDLGMVTPAGISFAQARQLLPHRAALDRAALEVANANVFSHWMQSWKQLFRRQR